MIRKLAATGLLILAGLTLLFYVVGNHGRLTFRPYMAQDWVIWGIAVISDMAGIYLFRRKANEK